MENILANPVPNRNIKIRIKAGAAVFAALVYGAYGFSQYPLKLSGFLSMFSGDNGYFTIEEYTGGSWKFVSKTPFPGRPYPDRYTTQTITLPQPSDRIRIIHDGSTQSAHIDSVLLGGDPPSSAEDLSGNNSLPLKKFAEADYDVVDARDRTLEFSWGKSGTVLNITGVAENFKGVPYEWPPIGYMEYRTGGGVKSYTFDAIPVSSHPYATRFAYLNSDKDNLYIYVDWTSDNTLDLNGDWIEIGVMTNGGLKKFYMDNYKKEWGTPSFGYTDKVSWQHKTYSFVIPLKEISAHYGDVVEFRIRYYGTDGGGGGGDGGGGGGGDGGGSAGGDGGGSAGADGGGGAAADGGGSSGGAAAGADGGGAAGGNGGGSAGADGGGAAGASGGGSAGGSGGGSAGGGAAGGTGGGGATPALPVIIPPISCSPLSQNISPNQSAFLSAGGGSGSYFWTAPNGTPATGVGGVFNAVFTAIGTQTINLTDNSQTTQCSVNVIPLSSQPISCSPQSQNVNIGQTVSIAGSGGNGSFFWTAANGTPSTGAGTNFNTTYNTAGTQTISLSDGTQTAQCSVNVASATSTTPTLSCSPSSQTVNINQQASFTATGGNGAFAWTAPNGTPMTGVGPSFGSSYGTSGNQTVTLTSGNQSAQCSVNVTSTSSVVNPVTPISCSPSSQNTNTNQQVSFTASGGNGSYFWTAANGTPMTGVGNTFSSVYTSAGTMTVSVTDNTQTAQCSVSVSAPVASSSPVTCSPLSQTVNTNQFASFTATGGNGAFAWTAPNGTPMTGVGPGFNSLYSATGTQAVTVASGNQSAQCSVDVTSTPVTVIPSSPITCSSSLQTANTNQTVSFTASGGNGSFFWTAPNGTPMTGVGSSFNTFYSVGGNQTASVTDNTQTAQCSVGINAPVVTPPVSGGGGGGGGGGAGPVFSPVGGGGSGAVLASFGGTPHMITLISTRVASPFIYLSQGPYTGLSDDLETVSFFSLLLAVSGTFSYFFAAWQSRKRDDIVKFTPIS